MPKPVIPGLGIFLKILVYDFNYQFTTLIVENIYSGRPTLFTLVISHAQTWKQKCPNLTF